MHQGHRRRMYEKLKNGDKMYDHERLEILLFNAYPRINTNPIAHALLNTFVNLSGVLNASVEELCTVDGVGENVALYLKTIGECTKYLCGNPDAAVLKNFEDFLSYAVTRMRGRTEEVLEFYCLEKNGKLKKTFTFSCNEKNKVMVDADKIIKIIATVKPYGLFIAHNHLSGKSEPSLSDDRFTKQLQLICNMNTVNFYDHCIYAADDNVFSYYKSGKLDAIKNTYSLENFINMNDK